MITRKFIGLLSTAKATFHRKLLFLPLLTRFIPLPTLHSSGNAIGQSGGSVTEIIPVHILAIPLR